MTLADPMTAATALRPLWRRVVWRTWRIVVAIPSVVLLVSIFVTVTAQVVQDRWAWLAFIFYIPIWPIGLAAVAWDLLRLGWALPLRWLMFCLGVATVTLGIGAQFGPRREPERLLTGESGTPISIVQWNIRWGGARGPDSLQEIIRELRAQRGDIMLLSELPPTEWFLHEWRRSGGPEPLHHAVAGYGPGQDDYWYRVGLFSRWPVALREIWKLPAGRAALFEVSVDENRPFRVLAVDLESSPHIHRAPSLLRVAEIAESLSTGGAPADVIAGDFNSPSRAFGFDKILQAAGGYRRAALWSGQWRGTYRQDYPVLDIDHVLVGATGAIQRSRLFVNPASDHRGQQVQILLRR